MFDRENLPFLLACIALVLSFLLTIALHVGSDSSDVAAWVQAIGSIGAIIGTALMVERQHRLHADHENRLRLERQRHELEIALNTLRALKLDIDRIVDGMIMKVRRESFAAEVRSLIWPREIEGYVSVLRTLNPENLPDARLRLEMVRVERRADLFISWCKKMKNNQDGTTTRVTIRMFIYFGSNLHSSIRVVENALMKL